MNKYGNIRSSYKGHVFHSRKEAEFSRTLDTLRRATDPKQRVKDIVYQPRYPIVINGKKVCTYVGDFFVTFEDGHSVLYDVKGYRTDIFILKKKLVEAVLGIEIVEV